MRTGTLLAALLLVGLAVFFAPRLGPARRVPDSTPVPSPDVPDPVVLRDLGPLLDALPTGEPVSTYPNEAWRLLHGLRERNRSHAMAGEYARAVGWLAAAREHARRLRAEPRYLEEWQVRTNFRFHPLLRDSRFVVVSRPPWLVFVEEGAGAREEANRSARWLAALTMHMEEHLAKPCGMPAFVDLPRRMERVLTMVVFRNVKTFRENLRRAGHPIGPLDDGRYDRKLEGSFSFLRPGEDRSKWASRLLLPAAFQSLHVLFHHGLERENRQGEELDWDVRGMTGALLWFREGLARTLCAASVAEDGSVKLCTVRPGYLRILRDAEERLDFATFLRVSTSGDLWRKACDLGLDRRSAYEIEFEFLARSWAFVHFLRQRGEGKLLEYLQRELRGETGFRYWKKVWAPPDGDWSPLEKEFEAWLQEIFEQEGIK